MRSAAMSRLFLLASACVTQACGGSLAVEHPSAPVDSELPAPYTADGRLPLETLFGRFDSLTRDHGWQAETVYTYRAKGELAIRAWRTPHRGPALWVLAGIHGEEPAGPNAIAASLGSITELAATGVPVVIIPVCNPVAYRNNWRYPNTADRDWHSGGYSVGDAEYLLPDLETGTRPRAAAAPGSETKALTGFVLGLAESYPPLLVLDLHEDELSTAGGYIYTQGQRADDTAVGAEIIRLLQAAGMPLRLAGKTRFGEPIVNGMISRDEQGGPIRDGSIDELLAASEVFTEGRKSPGPSSRNVIVVETPAFAGSRLEMRVAAQSAVLKQVHELWRLNAALPGQGPGH